MKILLSNSIYFLLSAVFITLILVDSVQAQTEQKIVKIRAEVAATNKGLSKYTKTIKDVEGIALEGTQATYYNSAKKVRKITAEMNGETYNATAEFYYADGELIFVYLKRNQYDTQIGTGKTPKVTLAEEQRFYFADGDLIRLLIGKKELKSNDEKYSELKDEIIKISDKLEDSNSQARKIDLSTKEGVLIELGKHKNADLSNAKICIERLQESTEIIIIGLFRYDAGCRFDGAFVNSVYIEKGADLSKKALLALGWEKADRIEREKLALAWVEKGLLAFATVLYTKDKDFKDGEFQPPQVVSTENGEVVVKLWTSVMKRKKEYHHLEFKFTKDGNLSGN